MRPIDADELTEMVWRERLDTRERIANLIARQPTIKRSVKRGKWIEVSPKHSRCSVCDTTCLIAVYPISKGANYCPNCGADMRGDKNNA